MYASNVFCRVATISVSVDLVLGTPPQIVVLGTLFTLTFASLTSLELYKLCLNGGITGLPTVPTMPTRWGLSAENADQLSLSAENADQISLSAENSVLFHALFVPIFKKRSVR